MRRSRCVCCWEETGTGPLRLLWSHEEALEADTYCGMKDFIPITHARWLADRIPNVTTHFPPEQDHTNIEENNRAAAYGWLKDLIQG
jgi:hypothetical protein